MSLCLCLIHKTIILTYYIYFICAYISAYAHICICVTQIEDELDQNVVPLETYILPKHAAVWIENSNMYSSAFDSKKLMTLRKQR